MMRVTERSNSKPVLAAAAIPADADVDNSRPGADAKRHKVDTQRVVAPKTCDHKNSRKGVSGRVNRKVKCGFPLVPSAQSAHVLVCPENHRTAVQMFAFADVSALIRSFRQHILAHIRAARVARGFSVVSMPFLSEATDIWLKFAGCGPPVVDRTTAHGSTFRVCVLIVFAFTVDHCLCFLCFHSSCFEHIDSICVHCLPAGLHGSQSNGP